MPYCPLPDRAVVSLAGDDVSGFLDALVTNNVHLVTPTQAIYAALLTPQGKYLFDFFIAAYDGRLLLDCEAARKDELIKRLKMYKLRAKIDITDESADMTVLAAFGDDAPSAFSLADEAGTARQMDRGVAYVDPRLSTAGVRAIVADVAATAAETGLAAADADAYEAHRLSLALPAPGADLIVDKSILLESNFEELNGVDFSKGCFVGQEVTARTRYRGLIKKRLLAVTFDGPEPPAGTTITLDGRDAGTMGSSHGGQGIALLRLERLEQAQSTGMPLLAGDVKVTPMKPDWLTADLPV